MSLLGAGRGLLQGSSHKEVTQALLPLSWPCLISSHIPFLPQVPQSWLQGLAAALGTSALRSSRGVVLCGAVCWGRVLAPCGWSGEKPPPRDSVPGTVKGLQPVPSCEHTSSEKEATCSGSHSMCPMKTRAQVRDLGPSFLFHRFQKHSTKH